MKVTDTRYRSLSPTQIHTSPTRPPVAAAASLKWQLGHHNSSNQCNITVRVIRMHFSEITLGSLRRADNGPTQVTGSHIRETLPQAG